MFLNGLSKLSKHVPNDRSQITEYLDRIADYVFQNLIIRAESGSWRICELEFYLSTPNHRDPFCNKDHQQQEFGRWYFHESGIDITFGTEGYASFLIRGIINTEIDNGTISGPLKVLKTLLNSSTTIDNAQIPLVAEYQDNMEPTSWIKHERIGLNKKKELILREKFGSDDDELFFNKPYRYISFLIPNHSFRNKLKVLQDEFEKKGNRDRIQKAFSYTPNFLK